MGSLAAVTSKGCLMFAFFLCDHIGAFKNHKSGSLVKIILLNRMFKYHKLVFSATAIIQYPIHKFDRTRAMLTLSLIPQKSITPAALLFSMSSGIPQKLFIMTLIAQHTTELQLEINFMHFLPHTTTI